MTRLILTTSDSGAGCLGQTGIADIVIPFDFRFVWGPLPSVSDLATLFATRSEQHGPTVPHWLDNFDNGHREKIRQKGFGLLDLCGQCETVDLWVDPEPNAQLMLICLLDFFHSHGRSPSPMTLFQADVVIGNQSPETLSKWKPVAVQVDNDCFEAASTAWDAYRQPTPQAWFDLLGKDLGVLPQLRQSVLELLEELPAPATGLGATEMHLLELISVGDATPFDLFPGHDRRNKRRVFGYWEVGSLLDGLANCSSPAISGLDGSPFTLELHDDRSRLKRYEQSSLSLTALGRKILAQTEDFSRHNPINRWWGGTELRNDCLWRWDAVGRSLIVPQAA